jgi:inosine-uridine nucleoside N-ribohydrolase
MRRWLIGCAVSTVMLTPACRSATQPGSPVSHVIVHTDMGSDDIIALAYLLKEPEVVVDAVVVAGDGLVHRDPGVTHARELIASLRVGDIPVGGGLEAPSSGTRTFPREWRETSDQFYGLTLPAVASAPAEDGVALLTSAVISSDGVTIVELAPQTDLASALTATPSLRNQIDRIVAMGGAFDVPGNVAAEPAAEWNLYIDPQAAEEVQGSGVPITLVPLDATKDLALTTLFMGALADDLRAPGVGRVYQLLKMNPYLIGNSYLWDPLAAALAVDPSLAVMSDRPVRIDAGTGSTSAEGSLQMRVAGSADALGIESRLIAALREVPGSTIIVPASVVTVTVDAAGYSLTTSQIVRAGRIAVDLRNETSRDLVVYLLDPGARHTSADVEALIVRGVTTPPPWLKVIAGVSADADTSSVWNVEVDRGEVAFVGAPRHGRFVPESVGYVRIVP